MIGKIAAQSELLASLSCCVGNFLAWSVVMKESLVNKNVMVDLSNWNCKWWSANCGNVIMSWRQWQQDEAPEGSSWQSWNAWVSWAEWTHDPPNHIIHCAQIGGSLGWYLRGAAFLAQPAGFHQMRDEFQHFTQNLVSSYHDSTPKKNVPTGLYIFAIKIIFSHIWLPKLDKFGKLLRKPQDLWLFHIFWTWHLKASPGAWHFQSVSEVAVYLLRSKGRMKIEKLWALDLFLSLKEGDIHI